MLSNWTISSLIVKDLSTISAPRFGTCTESTFPTLLSYSLNYS